MAQAKQVFKNASTQKAFDQWANKWIDGITRHELSDKDFYHFAHVYYKNRENISKEKFVYICKKWTKTSRNNRRGICQKYYGKLETIIDFMQWADANGILS